MEGISVDEKSRKQRIRKEEKEKEEENLKRLKERIVQETAE